ncbi:DET1 homolog [Octopus bimaculoides]|uniref:DET1 homolog n=1 Tax=Octopus bimaculoides TaxID=37653 RepID=A0A0L8FWL0_OCTBM|nr:DET1 homolog [Octopus bimaculoides]XP_014786467.1 DET1 homolog [Octopus bimaculoides]|eukprot:XP_014786466.1 PREDICTED: DET1 homolog [Octopus bimaculoides]
MFDTPRDNDADEIKPRKIPNQSIVHRVFNRQINFGRPGVQFNQSRMFYTNVFPNFTIVNVEKPPCFLRKFSPDGHYFIAFSATQTSLEIYEFNGPAAASDLLRHFNGDHTPSVYDNRLHYLHSKLFERFFTQKQVTVVATNGEHLNRECSLFTDDGKYVIVGSAIFVPEDPYPFFFDVYRNNESVPPNPRCPLEDYCLHIVELETGLLCDTRQFKCDKIFLSHNQGLYLYKNTLAVLSVQHQTIHIFQITKDGHFVDVRSIGRFCFDDDESILHLGLDSKTQVHQIRPMTETTINSLKHRLLVFLYERAKRMDSIYELRKFYQYFDQFKSLRMWKMQLIDSEHLLIKYASEEVVTLRVSDPNSQPSFFVVYNMITTEVLAVYENTSENLLELFENFCDVFRNAMLHSDMQFTCSASSNIYARQMQHRFKQTIINAKFGGHTEAVKRLLAQLPISAQSFSSSPYLDLALFSYDEKWVSMMERPKACGDHPIRFYARDSGLLKFKIYAGLQGRNPPPTARRLVAFTFHPYEPFAISIQRTNAEYVVNFHVRHIAYEAD